MHFGDDDSEYIPIWEDSALALQGTATPLVSLSLQKATDGVGDLAQR